MRRLAAGDGRSDIGQRRGDLVELVDRATGQADVSADLVTRVTFRSFR